MDAHNLSTEKTVILIAAANSASAIVNLLGFNVASGITEAAMQQGGVGLLLTLLILAVPTMAAQFFQGTLGQFASYAQVNGAAGGRSAKEQMIDERRQAEDWKRYSGGGSGASNPGTVTRPNTPSSLGSAGNPNHPAFGQRTGNG